MAKKLFALLIACLSIHAYSAENDISWRYNVDYYQLDNGLKVTLKETGRENNVAIQIVVGYGSDDEPCGKREMAHFLEHLLFTGTKEYDESTLEKMATSYGAQWNAYTEFDRTIFVMQVHSDNAINGLTLLNKILTESAITAENVEKSRKIIHREAGGERSALTQFFYNLDLMKSATTQMLNDNDNLSACKKIEQASSITRDEILQAYQAWYAPNNMHIYVVGRFDKTIKNEINNLFGNLQSRDMPARIDKTQQPPARHEYYSKLDPLYSDDAKVLYWFLFPPLSDTDYFAGALLAEYLNEKFYEAIRIKAGLSYDPSVNFYSHIYHGSMTFAATIDNNDVDKLRTEIKKFIEETASGEISEPDLERVRKSIISYISQDTPNNYSLSMFYADSMARFDNKGHYANEITGFKNVNSDDLKRFINLYLSKEPVVAIESPTMSVNAFWILVTAPPLLVVLVVGWWLWRKKKKMKPA